MTTPNSNYQLNNELIRIREELLALRYAALNLPGLLPSNCNEGDMREILISECISNLQELLKNSDKIKDVKL